MTDTTAPRTTSEPEEDDAPVLSHSWSDSRALRNNMLTIGAWLVALIAAIPLISVLYMLIVQGGSRLSTDLFTELPPAGFEMGGGFGNANQVSLSLFAPAETLAALLASHFPEAGPAEVEVLMYAALVLLAITLVVNVAGIGLLTMTQRHISGKA